MNGVHELGIAATKLRPPTSPARLVRRSRLADLLSDGMTKSVPLLLVSAPAGSGKSTLIASWALELERPVAWLQVESADSDPASFWSSLVAAIGRCRPDVASGVGPLVTGSQGDGRVVVPAIINGLIDVKDPLVIVIDDYHLIDSDSVHRGVERLIDLCPEQLTIVVSTRVDPPFRLGRMRVGNRLWEIRAEQLRFAIDEATFCSERPATTSPQSTSPTCAPRLKVGLRDSFWPGSAWNAHPTQAASSMRSAVTTSSS